MGYKNGRVVEDDEMVMSPLGTAEGIFAVMIGAEKSSDKAAETASPSRPDDDSQTQDAQGTGLGLGTGQ